MDNEASRDLEEILELLRQYDAIKSALAVLNDAWKNLLKEHSSDTQVSREASCLYFRRAAETYAPIVDWVRNVERCHKLALTSFDELGDGKLFAASEIWIPQPEYEPADVANMCERARRYLLKLVNLIQATRPSPLKATRRGAGRPKDQDLKLIKDAVRRVYAQLERSDERAPSHKQLCDRLDGEKIPLPEGTKWSAAKSWAKAYETQSPAVSTWLSGAISSSE